MPVDANSLASEHDPALSGRYLLEPSRSPGFEDLSHFLVWWSVRHLRVVETINLMSRNVDQKWVGSGWQQGREFQGLHQNMGLLGPAPSLENEEAEGCACGLEN
ncbi:hypothetical protein OIU79_017714 [Salix purpurea]|uniref:Uncharacterized protein n=1 Tax=Salix purpurea TaxID=77065 RepID=A0A9Q0WWZ2_SALPP|nr:hypothetical protein OIU79_017714 [Salix purpurea]